MRDKYFQFILDNSISDILSEIDGLSYSKKYDIIKELSINYTIHCINISLYVYKKEYIDLNRVRLNYIRNTLKNICERKQYGNIQS